MSGGEAISIREATESDLEAIRRIYNGVIERSTAVWSERPVDEAERRRWLGAKRAAAEPVLVAEGAAGEGVIGFGTYGRFRRVCGSERTVEHTVHVAIDRRRSGAGSALLGALVERARAERKRTMIAAVGADNEGSIRFHERHGFRQVGRLPGIGEKWGRRLDLVLLQREL